MPDLCIYIVHQIRAVLARRDRGLHTACLMSAGSAARRLREPGMA